MVIVSPVGPLPNGRNLWLINGDDPNYLRYLGAHPPSKGPRDLQTSHALWVPPTLRVPVLLASMVARWNASRFPPKNGDPPPLNATANKKPAPRQKSQKACIQAVKNVKRYAEIFFFKPWSLRLVNSILHTPETNSKSN